MQIKASALVRVVIQLLVLVLSVRVVAENSNVKDNLAANSGKTNQELAIIKLEKEMPLEIDPKVYLNAYTYYLQNNQLDKADNIFQMCARNMLMKLKNRRVSKSDCEDINAVFQKEYAKIAFEQKKYQEFINKCDELQTAKIQLSLETEYKYLLALITLQKHEQASKYADRLQERAALKYGNDSAQVEKIIAHKAEIYEQRNMYKEAADCYEIILNIRLKAYNYRGHPEVYEILDKMAKCCEITHNEQLSEKTEKQRLELSKNPWVNTPLVRESYQNMSFY